MCYSVIPRHHQKLYDAGRRLTGAGGGEFAELIIWMLNVQLDMEAPWKLAIGY